MLDCRAKAADRYGFAIIHPTAPLFSNVSGGIQQFLQLALVVLETVGSLHGHGLPPSFEAIEVVVRRWQALQPTPLSEFRPDRLGVRALNH
jgi:hypothetical protein